MQRCGHRLHRLARLCEDSTPGLARRLCQPDAVVSRVLLLESRIPFLHQFQACHSRAPCNGDPSSHPAGLPSQQCTTAGLLRTATGPASTSSHQQASASACILTSPQLHMTISYFSPASTARQVHIPAPQHVPPVVEPMQSEPSSQPESAEEQQQHPGPDTSLLNATQQGQWDHASNAFMGSILIKPQSNRKAYWICSRCPKGLPHKWHASVTSIFRSSKSNNNGCPYCSSNAVCAHNSLAQRAPHLVAEWDTLRNVDTPHDYTYKSKHYTSWVCATGHTWQARIAHRVHYNGGCPDCAKARNRKRAPFLINSSSHIMQIWNYAKNAKADLNPSKLTCGSNRRAYFICPEGHQWTARIVTISAITNTTGCPVCSRRSRSKH